MHIWITCENPSCGKPAFREEKVRVCSSKCGRELKSMEKKPDTLGGVIHMPAAPTVRASRKQEREVAAATGGKVQSASGALPGRGGDVIMVGDLLCELKTTGKTTFTLNARLLDKIAGEAAEQGRQPGVIVDLKDTVLMGTRRLVVLEFSVLKRLLGELE